MLISSTDEGSFVSGSIVWKTPQALHALVSGVNGSQISFGLNGELLERRTAEERGYSVDKLNATLEISIPYNTEGGYRKVWAIRNIYFSSPNLKETFLVRICVPVISAYS